MLSHPIDDLTLYNRLSVLFFALAWGTSKLSFYDYALSSHLHQNHSTRLIELFFRSFAAITLYFSAFH